MAAPTAVQDRPHTQAQVRYVRMSASKARQVLALIRGKSVGAADDVLALSERDAARVIQKCLRSAVANAEHNDGLDPEELFVATCFADEGPTLRRFRPPGPGPGHLHPQAHLPHHGGRGPLRRRRAVRPP